MGMDTSRVGFLGWSMGGYGALLLGARLGPARTAGICAISPALFSSFTGSAPGAFDSYDDWMAHRVVGLPALNQIPLRVDCGTSDRFYFATRQFVNQLKNPPAGSFSPAGMTRSTGASTFPVNSPGWRPSHACGPHEPTKLMTRRR
ncbi:putative esterase [Mycobacterium ulcerans str. Harvey]|uniref:Esterase n=1 Tax=Mycobacterium ulcerans str. Harvey TaxID=1299332 RepID=A0ABP3AS01_MYCUL|nr:putative esterase [Mycobacterium ulcerans str. Harvey]